MTTNSEWLDYLAQNAPDELAAWFDAEHVENQERALDGDTAAQNADSRERLEADIESYSAFDMMDTITLDMVIEWLDRQAAITERELCAKCEWPSLAAMPDLEQQERIAEQDRRIVEYAEQVDSLTAERERYRSKFGKCLDYADAIHALMDDEGMA